MKKIYFILISTVFTLHLFCQEKTVWLLDSTNAFSWDTVTNEWIPEEIGCWGGCGGHWVYTYDIYGNLAETHIYSPDPETFDRINFSDIIYVNDARGNVIEEIHNYWDSELNTWNYSYRSVSDYDAEGNQIEKIDFYWDAELKSWNYSFRSVSAFDINGNLIEEIGFGWDTQTQSWINSFRSEYTYSANWKHTEIFMYNWNSESNDWEYYYCRVKNYDESGNEIESTGSYWNQEAGSFVFSYQSISSFDANDKLTENIYYSYDQETKAMVQSNRYTYTYDENGNQTEEIRNNWDSESNNWVNSYRRVFIYDTNGNQIEVVVNDWDSELTDWIYIDKTESYYSELLISGTDNFNELSFVIYPNPAKDELTIEFGENVNARTSIALYDIAGKAVYSENLESASLNHTINLSSLRKGLYLIHISNDQYSYTEKVIKVE